MELIVAGALIGFVVAWAMFRRENWRLEDKVAEKQRQIDAMLRQGVARAVRDGERQCSREQSDYFMNW